MTGNVIITFDICCKIIEKIEFMKACLPRSMTNEEKVPYRN